MAVTQTPLGLVVTGAGFTENSWRALGDSLKKQRASNNWAIGDWLIHGESFPRIVDDAMRATGLKRQTLHNIKWVASVYAYDQRIQGAAWEHHRLLINVQDIATRQRLLRLSAQHHWGETELLGRVYSGAPFDDRVPVRRRLSAWVSPELHEKLQAYCYNNGYTVSGAVERILEAALSVRRRVVVDKEEEARVPNG